MDTPLHHMPSVPLLLWQAIARMEGWYANLPDLTRCQRNHNPGNIRHGEFTTVHKSTGEDEAGFAVFATDEDGIACLQALLSTPFYSEKTLRGAIFTYAPTSENQTYNYLENVSFWSNKPISMTVGAILASESQVA